MKKLLELLSQRRVWAAILGGVVALLSVLSIDYSLDVDFLGNTLANLFQAASSVLAAGLALHSYFYPKKQ